KRLFRNGRIIGRRFKLVHIYYGAHILEVATFRREPYQKEPEVEADTAPVETGRASELALDAENGRLDDLLIVEDNAFGTAEEILRLMRSGTALGAFRMLRACGALKVILPAIDHYLGPKDEPEARAETFWRLLEALDADVHQGFVPTTAVCIALLYLRIIERE